jgi:hypothetical protein
LKQPNCLFCGRLHPGDCLGSAQDQIVKDVFAWPGYLALIFHDHDDLTVSAPSCPRCQAEARLLALRAQAQAEQQTRDKFR